MEMYNIGKMLLDCVHTIPTVIYGLSCLAVTMYIALAMYITLVLNCVHIM